MKNKLITIMLLAVLMMSDSITANADETEVTVSEQDATKQEDCTVRAELPGQYTVTIPKTIMLDKDTKSAEYTVTVEGDTSAAATVTVIPDEQIPLQQKGKEDVIATITQDKKAWTFNEFGTTANGTITAEDLTAGSWSGTLKFDISLEIELEAGLYDAEGVMLCTWEESGIDVETNYTSGNYQTETASPYYVLTNTYPAAKKVVIPDTVVGIGDYAFCQCKGITNITIPDSITRIGSYAFNNCTSLSNVIIPNSVTEMGDCIFVACTNLTGIKLSENITYIGNYAFAKCESLTSVIIPEKVTNMSWYVFSECTNLEKVVLSDNITTIPDGTFEECKALTDIIIPNGVSTIEYEAFWGCTSLTDVEIPDSVISIEQDAFSGCTSLSNLIIPNSVTSIGTNAFLSIPQITYSGTAEGSPWGAVQVN